MLSKFWGDPKGKKPATEQGSLQILERTRHTLWTLERKFAKNHCQDPYIHKISWWPAGRKHQLIIQRIDRDTYEAGTKKSLHKEKYWEIWEYYNGRVYPYRNTSGNRNPIIPAGYVSLKAKKDEEGNEKFGFYGFRFDPERANGTFLYPDPYITDLIEDKKLIDLIYSIDLSDLPTKNGGVSSLLRAIQLYDKNLLSPLNLSSHFQERWKDLFGNTPNGEPNNNRKAIDDALGKLDDVLARVLSEMKSVEDDRSSAPLHDRFLVGNIDALKGKKGFWEIYAEVYLLDAETIMKPDASLAQGGSFADFLATFRTRKNHPAGMLPASNECLDVKPKYDPDVLRYEAGEFDLTDKGEGAKWMPFPPNQEQNKKRYQIRRKEPSMLSVIKPRYTYEEFSKRDDYHHSTFESDASESDDDGSRDKEKM